MADYLPRRTSLSFRGLTLEDERDLSDVHEHVEYFADKFIVSALSRNPLTGEKVEAATVS